MLKSLISCRLFNTIFDINDSNLERLNIKYYFIDYDNTIMPWGSDHLSEKIIQHFNNLHKAGIKIYIITNGTGERIETLKKNIPDYIKILDNSKKPRLRKIKQFVEENKIDTSKSVFIGDNLITDIYVGNKLGMYTIKVNPIAKKEYWATKIYRMIEVMIYFIYKKKFKELNEKSNNNR